MSAAIAFFAFFMFGICCGFLGLIGLLWWLSEEMSQY
jgi:hypothetical protein